MRTDSQPVDHPSAAVEEKSFPASIRSERRPRLLFALLCGGMLINGVLWLGGCATTVDRRVEQIITAELPRIVGKAASYKVDVEGASFTGDLADLRQVRIVGERVARPKSPILDHIDVSLSDVVVDRAGRRVVKVGAAEGIVRILGRDIAAFLSARPGLDNVVVTLHPPYEMTVESQFSAAGFALPTAARGRLRGRLVTRNGGLVLEIVDLRFAGIPIGTIPAFVLERLVNPLVDLSALPAPSRVNSVEVTQFALLLTASGSQSESGSAADYAASRRVSR